MAFFFKCVVVWVMLAMLLQAEAVQSKDDYIKNKNSVYSLEERNLIALGRILNTLQKLADQKAKCDKEDATNEMLQSLISAVENTQNSVQTIAEAAKQSIIDSNAKFESLLNTIQNTQESVEVYAKSTADAIAKLLPGSSNTEISGGPTTPATNWDLCEHPYFLVGDECFSVNTNTRSWESAKRQCQIDGGSLATPRDLDSLRQHIIRTGEQGDYWIGGHQEDGNWKWITGDPVEDEWGTGAPSGRDGEDCLDFITGSWPSLNDYECHEHQKYICERSYTGTVPPTPEPIDCSSVDAIQVGRKCLIISHDKLDWPDAAASCRNKGGMLASLHDKTDIQSFHDYLYINYGGSGKIFWLGGSDTANEGDWVWMDGQPIQKFPWRNPEPNGGTNENCLDWGHSNHFNDAPCDIRWRYVCEIDVNGRNSTALPSTINSDLCDYPYFLVGEECFRIYREERSWNSAQLQCQRDGGDLAAPKSLDLLRDHLTNSGDADDYWIGGHEVNGNWKWITGDAIEDGWRPDQPSKRDNEDCLDFMANYSPSLNDYECHKEQNYICERPYTGTVKQTLDPGMSEIETTTVNPSVCAAPYFLVGGECFSISNDKLSWETATAECKRQGGDLAVPKDLKFLRQHLMNSGDIDDYWIGGHDKDGKWKWITGDPVEDDWDDGAPSNYTEEDCLDFRVNRWPSLNDYQCYKTQKYLCEKPMNGSTVSPPTNTQTNLGSTLNDSVTESSF